jgi:Gamma-glutamyl phosphate reductase
MIKKYLRDIGIKSKIAFNSLSQINIKKRNKVLETYIKKLSKNKKKIIKENIKDINL